MATESKLDQEGRREEVAQMVVDGKTAADIGRRFEVSRQTAARWLKDPEVKNHIAKAQRDQGVLMRRQVYSAIQKRLENPGEIDLDTLLKLEKQLPPLPDDEVAAESDFIKELYLLADEYPAVAEALRIMVEVKGILPPNFSKKDEEPEDTDDPES